MDRFSHVWIMVFMVTLLAFSVQSSPTDRAMNRELRGDDEPLETPKRDMREHRVCLKTIKTRGLLRIDVGTKDNIMFKANSRTSSTYYVFYDGGLANGERKCSNVFMHDLADGSTPYSAVTSLDIRTDGSDKWWPEYIEIRRPFAGDCFRCRAAIPGLCRGEAGCSVWRGHSRNVACEPC